MLAIAGAVTWVGYLVMTYGLSQLTGQNYSFLDLAIPGKFTLGSPAPDAPKAGSTTPPPGSGPTSNPVTLPPPSNCPPKSTWGVKGFATEAACKKATGLPCTKCYGSWKGFNGTIGVPTVLGAA
jgi:hypothetical protein